MTSEYAIEFTSLDPIPITDAGLFSPEHFEQDLILSINAGELAKRQFREISRVAGQRVSLTYEQHRGVPTNCFGETEYYVTGVQVQAQQ